MTISLLSEQVHSADSSGQLSLALMPSVDFSVFLILSNFFCWDRWIAAAMWRESNTLVEVALFPRLRDDFVALLTAFEDSILHAESPRGRV